MMKILQLFDSFSLNKILVTIVVVVDAVVDVAVAAIAALVVVNGVPPVRHVTPHYYSTRHPDIISLLSLLLCPSLGSSSIVLF